MTGRSCVLDVNDTLAPQGKVMEAVGTYFKENFRKYFADELSVLEHIKYVLGLDRKERAKDVKYMWAVSQVVSDGFRNGELKIPKYGDVDETLKKLKENEIDVFLFSETPGAENIQCGLGLQDYVAKSFSRTELVTDARGNPRLRTEYKANKTDPCTYADIASTLCHGWGSEEMIYIADTPEEVEAAKEVGTIEIPNMNRTPHIILGTKEVDNSNCWDRITVGGALIDRKENEETALAEKVKECYQIDF